MIKTITIGRIGPFFPNKTLIKAKNGAAKLPMQIPEKIATSILTFSNGTIFIKWAEIPNKAPWKTLNIVVDIILINQ